MSHFCMGVIVPVEHIDGASAYIDEVMEPFGENTVVDEYIEFERDELVRQFGAYKAENDTLDEDLEVLSKKDPTELTNDDLKIWSMYYHGKDTLDEDGNLLSDVNGDGRWDWYRIGGRWDGYLVGKDNSTENGFNFGKTHEILQNNSITVKQHKEDILVNFDKSLFGLIDSEGEWHERASMGWWGVTSNEKDEDVWKEKYLSVLDKEDGDYLIVCLDCHI